MYIYCTFSWSRYSAYMRKSQVHKLSPLFIKIHIFCKWVSHHTVRIPGLVICMIFVSFCKPSTDGRTPPGKDLFKYDLGTPVARYTLPGYLEEISGLSYYGKGKIACVQDEKALIYIWNLKKRRSLKSMNLGMMLITRILPWSVKRPIF